jgi:hypothetical protein
MNMAVELLQAWPPTVLVLGAILLLTQRRPLGDLINRIQKVDTRWASLEAGHKARTEQAAQQADESAKKAVAAVQPAPLSGGGDLSVTVGPADVDRQGHPAEVATLTLAEHRDALAQAMQEAFEYGYDARDSWPGSTRPRLEIRWLSDGPPTVYLAGT